MDNEWITKKPKWITKKESSPEWITKKEKKQNWITKKDTSIPESVEKEELKGSWIKKKDKKPPKMGNPAVVEIYEDARENVMINRNIPAMKHGSEVVVGKGGDYIKDLID